MIQYFELTPGESVECDCCQEEIVKGIDFDTLKCTKINLCFYCAKTIADRIPYPKRPDTLQIFSRTEIPDDNTHY